MALPEITIDWQHVAATTSLPAGIGVVIRTPSERSETGIAHVAFVTENLTRQQIKQAAYALADFNGDLDRLAEYEVAISQVDDAA